MLQALKKNKTWDALRELVPLVQFKQREKQPWRSVNFKPATLLKLTLLHECFSHFLNCTNGTKLRKTSLWPVFMKEERTIKIKCQLQTIVFYTIEPLKILKGISGANKVGDDLSKNLFHFIPQKVQNNF